jgi:hypothetical protein
MTEVVSRRRAWVELGVGYGLIVTVIWMPRHWQRYPYWAAIAWVAAVSAMSFPGWDGWGMRARGLGRTLWVLGVAVGLAAVGVGIAWRLGTLRVPGSAKLFFLTYVGYAIFSFLQQFLMLDFFLIRLLRLLPRREYAVVAAAGMFALAHLPSVLLTPATLVWGLVACAVFVRERNIYPLALAHAVMGITIAMTVPGPVSHNMRVGLGYLRYRPLVLPDGRPHAGVLRTVYPFGWPSRWSG